MKSLLSFALIQRNPFTLVPAFRGKTDKKPTGAEENVTVDTPERIELLSSRQNPFAISTHIFFGLPRAAHMSLA